MEKKALFLDMDGTTLNDQVEIPEENLEAMKAAVKAGHEECCWKTGGLTRLAAGM